MNNNDSNVNRAYVLMAIQSRKKQKFVNKITPKGLKQDSAVVNMDFLHGSFDFIIYSTE
jgi:hypothetical protein